MIHGDQVPQLAELYYNIYIAAFTTSGHPMYFIPSLIIFIVSLTGCAGKIGAYLIWGVEN